MAEHQWVSLGFFTPPVDASEIPNNHLGCIKPCEERINVLINWCRVSSIHSISNPNNALFRGNPSIDHTIGLFDPSKLQTWTVWTELFHPTCHVSHVSDSLHARSKTLVHLAGFVGDPAGRGVIFHGTPSWRVIKLDANQDGDFKVVLCSPRTLGVSKNRGTPNGWWK